MTPLVEVRRGDRRESLHHGWAVAVDAQGETVFSTGDPPSVYARSSAKPIQALPLIQSGAAAALDLSPAELAVCCASHGGLALHKETVIRVLSKAGATVEDLRCGAHSPLSSPQEPPGVLENNCSGKHAGMLAMCQFMGWPKATYLEPDHPLQREIRSTLEALVGQEVGWAPDGCGVPAWYLPLGGLARAFAALAKDTAGLRLFDAMRAHPDLVAGPDRRDTVLMKSIPGLVSKGGAEGLSAGCMPDRGLAWALKIADGNSRAVGPALMRLLAHLDIRPLSPLPDIAHPVLRNHAGAPIGEVRALELGYPASRRQKS